jgi:TM2 domain-containing membrane protein YozV
MGYGAPPPGPGGYGHPPGGYGPPPGGYGPPPGGYGPPPGGGFVPGAYAAPLAPLVQYSEKSRSTAFLLSYWLGFLGADRFYLGQTGLGVAKLLTCGGVGIWYFIDLILNALGELKDSEGRLLQPPGPVNGSPSVNGNHVLLAGVLAGSFGIDRFLLGHTALGVVKLLTCGGLGIWQIVDLVLVATGNVRDAQGNSLRWR